MHRDVRPGKNWGSEIIRGLDHAKAMIVILSANSNESPSVTKEVERAFGKGIVIIAVRTQEVVPSDSLEFFLSSDHWLDAIDAPLEVHIERLNRVVREYLVENGCQEPVSDTTPNETHQNGVSGPPKRYASTAPAMGMPSPQEEEPSISAIRKSEASGKIKGPTGWRKSKESRPFPQGKMGDRSRCCGIADSGRDLRIGEGKALPPKTITISLNSCACIINRCSGSFRTIDRGRPS